MAHVKYKWGFAMAMNQCARRLSFGLPQLLTRTPNLRTLRCLRGFVPRFVPFLLLRALAMRLAVRAHTLAQRCIGVSLCLWIPAPL